MNRLVDRNRSLVLATLFWTAVFELTACVFRFGFGFDSTRDTASILAHFTFGLRIHHGYIGILLPLVPVVFRNLRPSATRWLVIIGVSLLASDLIHHFFVLWPLTGSPHFHLVYPDTP